MSDSSIFGDESWSDVEWRKLLVSLVDDDIVSWKDVATLTLGHLNPSQVGTSLASSPGFKMEYEKGQVMRPVMNWFYAQNGRCLDCGTRLELQVDHVKPRQHYENPLDADFLKNIVLRCRRHNVIRRVSHQLGGKTHLTAEAALMWILFSFKPRSISDFVRMCRLYGMTMADIRMQEGWAMARWLNKLPNAYYIIDDDKKHSTLLLWPDGGVTRMWHGDAVPNLGKAKVITETAKTKDHLAILYAINRSELVRVQLLRYCVEIIPFSHYFSNQDAEALAIQYTPPDRKSAELPKSVERETKTAEGLGLEEMAALSKETADVLPAGQRTATIRPLLPRGSCVLDAVYLPDGQTACVTWKSKGKRGSRTKSFQMPTKGRTKKLCDLTATELQMSSFNLFVE